MYALSLDRNTRKDVGVPAQAIEVKQAKLMRQICESNYHLVQQVTQVKKSALKERIKVLEEDLTQLQTAFDSEKTTLISKEDHKKFINQLHEMHSQDT